MTLAISPLDTEREIRRLRNLFGQLQRIPQRRRDDECAEARALDILFLLRQLGDDCSDLRAIELSRQNEPACGIGQATFSTRYPLLQVTRTTP
ncbi:hypothetical protein SAMN05216456_1449 [Devosia crocina]|uniref:Uncharacterized protein n=1 Tax=Devosia crocina TaxID=429728 RepID=A0A1I7NAQ5_9HYPH|nr:hypothetical protein [Devosia crocina]SFV31762.1 hypothetical protein SAMN05216456_1449 [Devosia crocina]